MGYKNQRGMALVVVLWGIALLALIAASFTRTTRVQTLLAHNLVENAKAEALADGAVHRAAFGLVDPDLEGRWVADGRPYSYAQGEGEIRVSVEDEAGKIDLNAAPDPLLEALFLSAGLSGAEARTLIDRIADFRDPDDDPRPNGAEDRDYAQAGLGHEAKDAWFETLDELRQVLGVDRDLYNRLAPALTVYSGSSEVDPAAASAAVLAVLPGLSTAEAEAILAARSEDGGSARSIPSTVTVRAEARTAGGGVFVREAVIALTRNPAEPFHVLSWGRRWAAARPPAAEDRPLSPSRDPDGPGRPPQ